VPAASRSVKLPCSTNFMDVRENGRTQTRFSSSANTRPACGSFSIQDSLERCPLIGVDQKRPASDQNDANSPKRTLDGYLGIEVDDAPGNSGTS
jgi:hypothetical protein